MILEEILKDSKKRHKRMIVLIIIDSCLFKNEIWNKSVCYVLRCKKTRKNTNIYFLRKGGYISTAKLYYKFGRCQGIFLIIFWYVLRG